MKIKWKKFGDFLKPDRIVLKVLFLLAVIGIVLQVWRYNNECLKIMCEPAWLSVIYYVFWVTDFLNILLIANFLSPERIILFIDRAVVLFLQVCIWYLIGCFIAHPIKKGFIKLEKLVERREAEREKEMKARISHDLRQSEELEKERAKEAKEKRKDREK